MSPVISTDSYNHCPKCFITSDYTPSLPGIYAIYVCNTCTGCSEATDELGPASVATVSTIVEASISSKCVRGDVIRAIGTGGEARPPTCGVSLGLNASFSFAAFRGSSLKIGSKTLTAGNVFRGEAGGGYRSA
jgi:hypothetical protein